MLIPNNLPSLVIVKGLFRKYDADKSQTLDQREAERICRGQDMCNSLADIWRHLDQPGKANKPVSYEDFELAFREFLIGRSGIRDHLPEHIEQHDMDGDEALSLSEFRTMCRAFKICDISAALPTATQLFDRGLKDGQDRASSLSKSTIMSVFEQHMVPSHDDDGHQRREL